MNGKRLLTTTFYISLLSVITFLLFSPMPLQAKNMNLESESAILVDTDTGEILYAKNPDLALPPASMTKMMTEYLVWEAIESGEISWDQTTQISDYPYEISASPVFSGVGLRQNADYTVESLYEAMAINSDNGTTIALAELIADTEGEFVELMNQKAAEMKLSDYEFVNSTGLENKDLGDNYPEGTEPQGTNLLSARSSALLAYHLVNDFPDVLETSSIPQTEFDNHIIDNWNRMLPHEGQNFKQWYYEGVDGLKTGKTDLAGYSFTGTAEVDGKRLITVIMKADSEDQRFQETAQLLDYGFKNFELQEIFPEGYQLEDESILPVKKGKAKEVEIALNDSIERTIQPENVDEYSLAYHLNDDLLDEDGSLIAPIEEGMKVGTAEVIYEGNDYGYIDDQMAETFDVVTVSAVEKNNWFMITVHSTSDFFANFFTTVVDTIKGWF